MEAPKQRLLPLVNKMGLSQQLAQLCLGSSQSKHKLCLDNKPQLSANKHNNSHRCLELNNNLKLLHLGLNLLVRQAEQINHYLEDLKLRLQVHRSLDSNNNNPRLSLVGVHHK